MSRYSHQIRRPAIAKAITVTPRPITRRSTMGGSPLSQAGHGLIAHRGLVGCRLSPPVPGVSVTRAVGRKCYQAVSSPVPLRAVQKATLVDKGGHQAASSADSWSRRTSTSMAHDVSDLTSCPHLV